MTLIRYFAVFFAIALVSIGSAFAAEGDRIQYSRDSRYIYSKTPLPLLTLAPSPEQNEALRESSRRIIQQLEALKEINPRTGLRGRIDRTLVESADLFENSLSSLVDYAQKYYPALQRAGMTVSTAAPTGFVIFSGIELTGGFILSGGGSVMLGVAFVPMKVTRVEIDTQKTEEYLEFDSNLILWPSANIGAGVGGGTNFRGGVGLIWGELNNAKEFAGLVVGPSVSTNLGVGGNFKAQFLKNWNKKGAVSNFFLTAGLELGASAKLEGHGNISYLIDAQKYLKAGETGMTKFLEKFFGQAPDASRPANMKQISTLR